jgi:hypothetical protein
LLSAILARSLTSLIAVLLDYVLLASLAVLVMQVLRPLQSWRWNCRHPAIFSVMMLKIHASKAYGVASACKLFSFDTFLNCCKDVEYPISNKEKKGV